MEGDRRARRPGQTRIRLAAGSALLLALTGAAAPSAVADPQYVGARKCATCHRKELIGNQYRAWRRDRHHRAHDTLKGERARALAAERGLAAPPHQADECLRCHVTAHGVPPTRIAYELDPADGVQCESCHGPGRDYRKKRIMSDRDLARSKGLWDAGEQAAICTACHNPQSPTFDPARYVLPDGTTTGFDFEQAKGRIAHPIPADVKGRFVELEKQQKEQGKAGGGR